MARTYRRTSTKRTRRTRNPLYKSRTSTAVRKMGAFGLYRGTRFATLRQVGRAIRSRGYNTNPFPDNKLVKHRYTEIITLPAATATLPSKYVFWAHNLQDPNYTGVGHQPMFYDEMSAQYNKYCVVKSSIRIIIPPATTDNLVRTFHLWLDDSATSVPATFTDLNEQHRGRSCNILSQRNTPLIMRGWFDGPKYQKTTAKAYIGDQDNRTAAGSAPGYGRYWHLHCNETNGTALTDLKVQVEIIYYAHWSEPKDHTGS